MLSRTILKWASLVAISLAVVFMLSRAAMGQDRPPTSGSLQVIDEVGKPVRECPLKHTEVKAQVSGFLSRVTVTQDFENNFAEKIEAVYTFPLPEAAAVDDLTMLIGDRVVKGKIMRREEAQAAYTAAKQSGKIASLLDQQRPNIFTQQVANILPGQRIRITISYVETLKYQDGAYEWSFPMVVGARYLPTKDDQQQAPEQTNAVTELSHISPASALNGTRTGHDISLEIDVDAGLPIVGINSESHETVVQQINERRSVVRLKDYAIIPNKDFVLTYRVAGDTINDAVLAHRSDRGGFFTLILQPPQRVAAEDVMPKELVFVLDTSGSMEGFPVEKAKQTMQLALDNLYPHDTFNVITFSGDTEILFSEPVPATPANLRKAKKFLASQKGEGGTEMMKAIKAALDPSDSQYHVRIAVFMTDGQVGNDAEIISEVQKHPNARVFAMGFGDSPNRFLLDRMTQYGRGGVEYVSETGDTSSVARRFHERVRNPLLTDLSIDWSGMPVKDVYPARLPDLFSAQPVIVSGRYTAGGKGTIRLLGKMAGQNFVREIPIELPEQQNEHDVLATLWARRRIDDLVGQEMANLNNPSSQGEHREEITELGLNFKLMTQYTSFVAIDEVIFTGSDDPKRVEVDAASIISTGSSAITALVTVTSGASVMQSSVAGIVTNNFAVRTMQDLPLQGRSLQSLALLTPGSSPRQQSSFMVDGVNANYGITPGGQSPVLSASGTSPALTASGGANGIVTLDATQEVEVQTSPTQPVNGGAGTQVNVITRSGTNKFHGSAFHFFGNDALDANDWFANARTLNKPAKRLNNFGGTIGGPIDRDEIFFFASYEGLRLRQPMVGITDVPSLQARSAATNLMRPFLAAFPVPTGTAKPDGFAEFAASFANPARHDVGSVRIDHMLNAETTLRGRYNFADSAADQRGASGFSLNTINRIRSRAQTVTGSLDHFLSQTMALAVHANYSHLRVDGSYLLDEFGGAVIPPDVFSSPGSFSFDLNSRNAAFMTGNPTSNVQRQFNLNGSIAMVSGKHEYKFGGDYRLLTPGISLRQLEENVFFDGMAQAITGTAARVNRLNNSARQTPVFQSLSLFAQDEWRKSQRLTLTYGMRWEFAPPPSSENALAVDQVDEPATLKLAAPRSSLWETTFVNFAPHAGFAYEISRRNNRELVLRGSAGIRYDLARDRFGDVFAGSIPFVSGSAFFNSPFPPISSVTTGESLPLIAFDPHLKLPYIVDWNVSLQHALGSSQAISAAYLGSAGRRLLHTQTLFDANPNFSFLRLTTNRASSDYRGLQVKFERQLSSELAALVSYTLSESLDDVIDDSSRRVVVASTQPQLDRSSSDFDIRHQLTGFISYALPAPLSRGVGNKLSRNWAIDSIFNARSAKPVNVLFGFPTSVGLAYLRPNILNGASPYIFDPTTAGGRRLNPSAFVIPSDLQQGNLGRNSLRGFPLYQIDLALRRRFNFSEDVALQIQADAFNLFNHANFEDPVGNDLVLGNKLAFGQSTSMAGRSLSRGGFGSFYSFGGARSLRFSVKLLF